MGYFKLAVLGLLVVTVLAPTNARSRPTTNGIIVTPELLEAEIRALAAVKEMEKVVASNVASERASVLRQTCLPKGQLCWPQFAQDCCSGECIPTGMFHVNICT